MLITELVFANDVPQSFSEHYDLTWQLFIGSLAIAMGLIVILYRQALKRIDNAATKEDIEEIKKNCQTMQANCPKGTSLTKIEETLKQVSISNEQIAKTIERIFTRQDELRKDLPEKYILRVEYEKRHELITSLISDGFRTINIQLGDLTKSVSIMRGMNMKKEDV
jgi:hypothetical protein